MLLLPVIVVAIDADALGGRHHCHRGRRWGRSWSVVVVMDTLELGVGWSLRVLLGELGTLWLKGGLINDDAGVVVGDVDAVARNW